jgi:UBX domain-containing protein 1
LVRAGKNKGEEGKGEEPKNNLKITLYSNGFVIDDGQFRPYDAPENKEFMKELNEGYVPREIQDKYKGKGGVGVGLEDKR